MKDNRSMAVFKRTGRFSGDQRRGNDNPRGLNRVKDETISLLAHELLSPLTSIFCISEILRDSDDIKPCERRHFMDIIIHESERLNCLIDQVLWMLRTDSRCREGQGRAIDLHAVEASPTGLTKPSTPAAEPKRFYRFLQKPFRMG